MTTLVEGFFVVGDGPDGKPMLNLALSDSSSPSPPRVIESKLLAGIDTGANVCIVDTAIVAKHSIETFGFIETQPIGATLPKRVPTYMLQIILPEVPILQILCMSMDLRKDFGIDFLFGMNAIKMFELIVSRPRDRVTLEFISR